MVPLKVSTDKHPRVNNSKTVPGMVFDRTLLINIVVPMVTVCVLRWVMDLNSSCIGIVNSVTVFAVVVVVIWSQDRTQSDPVELCHYYRHLRVLRFHTAVRL